MSEADPRLSPGSYARIEPSEEARTLKTKLSESSAGGEQSSALRKEIWHANEAAPWAISQIYGNVKQLSPDAPIGLAKDANGKEFLYLSDAFKDSKAASNGRLFSTQEDPLMSINALSAYRYAGSSAFGQSLVAVASRMPETVLNSIKPNDDGSVTVNFPGARDEPITVSADKLATAAAKDEFDTEHRDGFRGTWPLALMEAYKSYRQNHGDASFNTDKEFWKNDSGGDRIKDALKLLTGKEVEQERMRYGMFPVSREATIGNLLENQETKRLPSIMYDEGYKSAHAIWNYLPEKKEAWSDIVRTVDYDMTGVHPRFAFDPQVLFYVKDEDKK